MIRGKVSYYTWPQVLGGECEEKKPLCIIYIIFLLKPCRPHTPKGSIREINFKNELN